MTGEMFDIRAIGVKMETIMTFQWSRIQESRDRVTRNFLSLAGVDAISLHERRIADCLVGMLEELGFEVTEDDAGARNGSEAGNLYGILRGSDKIRPVLLSAHMDTVTPGIGKEPVVSEDGERIFSAGDTVLGADDVCGIVEILEGVRLIRDAGEEFGDIEILLTIGEEIYGQGSKVFDYSRLRSKDAYVLDMSGCPGTAARRAPTIITFEAAVTGRAAHAGFSPEAGINALQAASKAIAQIEQGRISETATCNIGTIRAGSAPNIVPENCVTAGEVRSFDHEEALRLVSEIRRVFRESAEETGAALDFDHEIRVRAYETPETADVCREFRAACAACGLPGRLTSSGGGSDQNVYAEYGIEGLVLSCGMYLTHSTEEYTLIDELVLGAELVAELVRQRGAV